MIIVLTSCGFLRFSAELDNAPECFCFNYLGVLEDAAFFFLEEVCHCRQVLKASSCFQLVPSVLCCAVV